MSEAAEACREGGRSEGGSEGSSPPVMVTPPDELLRRMEEEQGEDAAREPMSGYARRAPAVVRQYAWARTLEGESHGVPPMETRGAAPRRGPRAEEAALERRSRVPLPAAGITAPAKCQYAAQRCSGCLEEMGLDEWIIPGGSAMVHNRADCYQRAMMALNESIAASVEGEMARARAAERQFCMPCPPPETWPTDDLPEVSAFNGEPLPMAAEGRPGPAAQTQRAIQMHPLNPPG